MTALPMSPSHAMASGALARRRSRVLGSGAGLRLPVPIALSDHDRYRAAGAVRAVARPDPRLRRHRLARPCRILRRRRLLRRAAGACTASSTSRCIALVVAGLAAMVLGFLTSFLVIRGVDLTRLMVTLGIALLMEALGRALLQHHRRHRRPAGHRDAADPRPVRLRHVRQGRLLLLPDRAVPVVPAGAAHRAFAVRPVAARDQEQSAAGRRRSAFPSTAA